MSGARLVGGTLTMLAGMGAWFIGKKIGGKIAKVTASRALQWPDGPADPVVEAVEVKPV